MNVCDAFSAGIGFPRVTHSISAPNHTSTKNLIRESVAMRTDMVGVWTFLFGLVVILIAEWWARRG